VRGSRKFVVRRSVMLNRIPKKLDIVAVDLQRLNKKSFQVLKNKCAQTRRNFAARLEPSVESTSPVRIFYAR
jgi:hypothetical protein